MECTRRSRNARRRPPAEEVGWATVIVVPDVAVKSAESGTKAQERRATYALLAVMNAVKEFGRTLTRSMGAHASDIETSSRSSLT